MLAYFILKLAIRQTGLYNKNMKIFLFVLISFVLFNFVYANNNQAPKFIIALDPGHGGKDPGAISLNKKLLEKNITQQVANRVKLLIDLIPNFKAMRTRTYDKTLSLGQRVALARKWDANLFLSIHADAALNGKQVNGVSVYIARNSKAISSRFYSRRRGYRMNPELNSFNYSMAKNILKELDQAFHVHQSKVQRAGFFVLKQPIPSVLLELGFMTSNKESRLLADENYQKRLAWAIFDGLQDTYNLYRKSGYFSGNKNINYYKLPKYLQYKVKTGDNLTNISNKLQLSLGQLRCLINKKDDFLKAGQKILIPLQGVHKIC